MKSALPLSILLMSGVAQATNVDISIERIGLVDFSHTRFPAFYHYSILSTGQSLGIVRPDTNVVAGRSENYSTLPYTGRDAWYYDGSTTQVVGLLDAEHTNSATGGTRQQIATFVNEQAVVGVANRYSVTGAGLGNSAWYYDGSSTNRIGLIDAEHTSPTSGSRFTTLEGLSATGTVFGESFRYDASGSTASTSPWAADAAGTTRIGLFDSDHTRASDGYRRSVMVQINDVGQAIGTSDRFLLTGIPSLGTTAWLYDGSATIDIGLLDAEHSGPTYGPSNTPTALNNSGQVVGEAARAAGGRTVWLYDGTTTSNIGLVDADHTDPTYGYRYSTSSGVINAAGQTMGTAVRYASDGRNLGQSAWLYDGTTTHRVGLIDSEHTGSIGSFADVQINTAEFLSETGAVAGTARRYSATTGNVIGQSTWVSDGTTTTRTGLFDATHTRVTDNYRDSENQAMNGAGQVLGRSDQFGASGALVGQSMWLWDGAATQNIGPTGSQFVNSTNGGSWSNAWYLNENGQVAGTAATYGVSGVSQTGTMAWFFDGDSTTVLDPAATGRSLFNNYDASLYRFDSTVEYLGDDGLILGLNRVYQSGSFIDEHLYGYRPDWGLFEFEVELDGDPDYIQQFWGSIDSVSAVNDKGEMFGHGTTLFGGQMTFKITVVPLPAAFWLMLSAIGLLTFRRKAA